MSYCFAPDESVHAAILRIAREEATDAAKRLRDSAGNRDEAIHEARKSVKKLRALIRLVSNELGSTADEENTHLRDVGRQMSELRNAAAMLEVIDGLEKHFGVVNHLAEVRQHFLTRKADAENGPKATAIMHAAATAFNGFAERAGNWPLTTDDFSAFKKGLKKSVRAGRRALACVKKEPSDENYHEWRKSAKDHWYHLRLLSGVMGRPIERREKQFDRLAETLGDDHNLVVLRDVLSAEPHVFSARRELSAFLKMLEERREELRD